ncbi:hypothetical protein GPUN_2151 [Glaciecola punicea ACAM 611]|uniref:DUF2797 domain-containing protein n=1 Tax=Glaciecola punicea ACAM 611 TaxID=1121923 RepID=H5TD89_9ALTE|nr:DUF2797 domain-containing protein [Glaciecola punicea]GAB56266.1 hypothetical protein GPUN_2151 [Glaciecola punicea ACAM 611]
MPNEWSGQIAKMHVSVDGDNNAQYQLPVGDSQVNMNALIGHEIAVQYSGEINCIHCNRKTKKSFSQGYCYVCLTRLARCDSCIIKPEKCHYEQGTCREPKWGEENCLQDHFVYLANTGQIKIGITRHVSKGVSSRWIDQGASQAMAIFRVKERLLSGLVEIEIAKHIGDKTNWRTMLKGQPDTLDLVTMQEKVHILIQKPLQAIQDKYGLQAVQALEPKPVEINYPVNHYPVKIKSINLDKEPIFEATLLGIKGQYLLLDEDRVINMRKYSGYSLSLQA